MYTTKTSHGSLTNLNYHAQVPFIQQPKIIGERIVKGVRIYFGEGRKRYLADRFDSFFKGVKTSIKEKGYKGRLIGVNYVEENY